MPTPYSKIRNKFIEKITDYDFSKYTDADKDITIDDYMISACSHFGKCKVNLQDRDETLQQFTGDLSDEDIEIIVDGMIVEWLRPKVLNTDILSNFLNTKELSIAASPASILKEIKDTLQYNRKEFKKSIKEYTHTHSDASKLN
jgi:hypothetical protein